MKKIVITLLSALAFAGCAADADLDSAEDLDSVEEARADRADIPFRVLTDFTVRSELGTTETRRVFTSAASFRAYFGATPAGVDFSRDWVAFYSAGVQRTGGYRASIMRVRPSATGLTLKVTTRIESPGEDCIVTQALTKPLVLVAFRSPRPAPSYVRYDRDDNTRSCAPPAPSCDTVRCAAGTHCELRPVVCVRAPCPPQPQCVPNVDRCAVIRCRVGTHCESTGTTASCVIDPGACLTDADCVLWDNYCGGCACNALGHNQRPVTCSNPVACFRQPCGGLVARCDTTTARCQAAPAPTGGVRCGRNTCATGQVCCNASCGICTPPGGACIQLACADR